MTEDVGCVVTNVSDLAWTEDYELVKGSLGLQVKMLVNDPKHKMVAFLAKMPAGYHQAAHTHHGIEASVILEGGQMAGGNMLGPNGFIFCRAGVEHGPFDYPDGCVVFVTRVVEPQNGAPGRHADASSAVNEVGFVAIDADKLPWQGGEESNLPSGLATKTLARIEALNLTVLMVKFGAGYVEHRHSHERTHSDCILAGKMILHGKTLQRGDFLYGPSHVEHGPMDYPEGCVVFAVVQGELAHK